MRDSTRRAIEDVRNNLNRIATGVEVLASPAPFRQENHFHGPAEAQVARHFERPAGTPEREGGPWREVGHLTGDPDSKVFVADIAKPEVTNADARVAVLAVSLNLKNRLDAKRVFEGSDVLATIDAYKRVQALRDLLGAVTDDELAEATALYDELAS